MSEFNVVTVKRASSDSKIYKNHDLQISFLKEKLAFGESQLQERDQQIESYKQIVETLEDLLKKEVRNVAISRAQPAPPPAPVETPVEIFKKKNTIKGRKTVSFHNG